MGRPPLPLGTWGEIRSYVAARNKKGKPTSFRALAYYRDFDGRTRQYERRGKTEAAAANNLRTFLKERTDLNSGQALTRQHRFSAAAVLWLGKVEAAADAGTRSPGTVETYRRQLDNHVLPALGELRLGEISTPLLDKFIGRIATEIGKPTAKTCRSIVSGVMGLAVRYGAGTVNPTREVDRIEGGPQKEPRALTMRERNDWIARLQKDERAVSADLPDLTLFLMATGVRIGEALAVLWSDVDIEAESVAVTSTIIRITGKGLIRKRTKSRAGDRRLPLPTWAVAMLERRFRRPGVRLDQAVFPDSLGGFRDPSNTRRTFREARGEEFAWVTSHVFRKTAATVLDEAGLTGRQIADQLGHARPSMTQDVYLGRKVVSRAAADALEGAIVTDTADSHG